MAKNEKKVTDLTVDELEFLIEDALDEKFVEWFGDPDEGLELRPEVKAQLTRSLKRLKAGERGIPMDKVAKKLGIKLEE